MNELMWSYEESVRRVSAKVQEWKAVTLKKSTLTDEIARDLYEAREQLDGRKNSYGNQYANVPNGTIATWSKYLEDVGLARNTVHRWLEHFDSQEQRLLTDEEYQRKEQEKQRKKMEHDRAIKNMVNQRIKENHIPADWNNEAEKEYQDRLIQEQRNREWKEKIQRESEERKSSIPKYDYSEANVNNDNIKKLLEELNSREAKREEISKKMRLTGDNAEHTFNHMLIEYLDSLNDDSQRLEACYNGIKIFKAYIREHNLVRG